MRGFLTVILFLIFFLTFHLAVFSFAISPLLNSDYIKNRLSESKIYTTVAEELPEIVEEQEETTTNFDSKFRYSSESRSSSFAGVNSGKIKI